MHVITPVGLFWLQELQIKTIYIGTGLKYSPTSYFPQFAYLIHAEPQEQQEHSEPNGEQEHIQIDGPLDVGNDGGQDANAVADDQGDN